MNKKVFTTKETDGPEFELAVVRPSPKVQVESQIKYNASWSIAEKGGSVLRRNLDDLAERHGLWGPELRTKVDELGNEILSLEKRLRSGAASFDSVESAKKVALQLMKLREERTEVLRTRNSLDGYTAESFADAARLQYLVSQCTVNNDTGKLYFKSYEDYLAKSDDKIGIDALNAYLELIYGDIKEEEVYELTWLKKYNFVDSESRLIDKQGRYISEDGKLIDKDYNYITDEGLRCDRDGQLVDKDGKYLIEYVEFPSEGV